MDRKILQAMVTFLGTVIDIIWQKPNYIDSRGPGVPRAALDGTVPHAPRRGHGR